MDLQIRKACADDIPQIVSLQACSLRQLSTEAYSSAQIEALVHTQEEARIRSFELNDETVYVAYAKAAGVTISAQMVAIAAYVPWQSKISGLYVHPQFARQGIASELLRTIEAEAIGQRRSVLRVMSSLMAVPFYEARGFHRLYARTVWFNQETVSCVEMAKPLASSNLLLEISKQFARQTAAVVGSLVAAVAFVYCIALLM